MVKDEADPLLRQLKHKRPTRRLAALQKLVAGKPEHIDDVLMEALRDESWLVRQAALNALARIDPNRSVTPILAALQGMEPGASSSPPRSLSADEILRLGLWRFREAHPIEAFTAAVTEPGPMRPAYAQALGELGDPRALEPLRQTLSDESAGSGTRAAAAEALGKLGSQSAISDLIPLMDDESRSVRHEAVHALARLGGEEARQALLQKVKSRGRGSWTARRALRTLDN
jgi:HEAT repeat-containing taxis protein